jgi:tetratricopeptide (TPR) repeat protein
MGLAASRKAGVRAMEIQCLIYLAQIRIYQGRLREGLAMARDVRSIAEKLPQRMEMMSLWAVRAGLQETGEYEEALALARRGTALAREARDVYLLGANLGRLGEAYEALQNLEEARAAYEEASERGQYGPFSHARFCVLAALAGEWIDAHAIRAHEVGTFFNPMFSIHLHHGIEALLRGGDEVLARAEVHRLAERAEKNDRDRMSYLRCLAVLGEWNGDTGAAMGHLREAEALAEKIGLPGELWQIRAKIGERHERQGEVDEAREAFSRAARTLKALAQKIGGEELRDGFLSAPRVRRVLERG